MKLQERSERFYFMDWLRIVVVILIIPHHVAVSFSHIGSGYVYTDVPVRSLYYFIQSDFLNLWFMRLLFFISGVSSFMALKRRSPIEYLIERVKKLFLPTLFVALILGPLTAFFVFKYRESFSGTFIGFYPRYILNIDKYLGWAHMWYCIYLFTFSIITVRLFVYLKSNFTVSKKLVAFLVRGNNIYLPMIFILVTESALRPYYPGFQNLVDDWANFILYLFLFILGFLIGHSSKILNILVKKNRGFFMISLISSIIYIYLNYSRKYLVNWVGNRDLSDYLFNVIMSNIRAVATYSWVMFFVGFGKRFLNRDNIYLRRLGRSSFGLYIFHYSILTVLNTYLISLEVAHYIIFIISTISTYLIYYLFYKSVIKNLLPLRFLCGLK